MGSDILLDLFHPSIFQQYSIFSYQQVIGTALYFIGIHAERFLQFCLPVDYSHATVWRHYASKLPNIVDTGAGFLILGAFIFQRKPDRVEWDPTFPGQNWI